MKNTQQLPYLLDLLDDDSDVVQESVLKELSSFGPSLEHELKRLEISLSPNQKDLLHSRLGEYHRSLLKEQWQTLINKEKDTVQLESALALLAEFQYGKEYPVKISTLLDGLADEYARTFSYADAIVLAHFLFFKKGMKGAESDYYNPLNCNLAYVLQEKRGIPISLVSVYILVGERLGLTIHGCNFPGHFLAIATSGNQMFVVDCYNGGRIVNRSDLNTPNGSTSLSLQNLLRLQCDTSTIIARTLRNLLNAYAKAGEEENALLMVELLDTMESFKDDDES